MCRGAKIILPQFVRVSKQGFRKQCALFVFDVGKRKRENMKKWKRNFKKSPENGAFGVGAKKKVFFVKMAFF